MDDLERFIVEAKRATYVGGGASTASSRLGSHDLAYQTGPWTYLDSYFGGTDFLGQETVWHHQVPVWAMNYYGKILRDDLIDAQGAGRVIKQALSALYAENRFLGGFVYSSDGYNYVDEVSGPVQSFLGREVILKEEIVAYELHYHGGLIRA